MRRSKRDGGYVWKFDPDEDGEPDLVGVDFEGDLQVDEYHREG